MPYLYVAQFDVSGLREGYPYIEKVPALHDDRYEVPADGTPVMGKPFAAETVVVRMVADVPVKLCFADGGESDQEHMLLPANEVARMRVNPGWTFSVVASTDGPADLADILKPPVLPI